MRESMKAKSWICFILLTLAAVAGEGCRPAAGSGVPGTPSQQQLTTPVKSPLIKQVIEGAIEQTGYTFSYDPSYARLSYPGGDVPLDRGVCSDVVVRAFRKAGVDLQKEVHEDMRRSFSAYPKQWGARRPDSNIDHRRVPNLMTYFKRARKDLPLAKDPAEYLPGDVVAWDLGNGLVHIGLVSNIKSDARGQGAASHNIIHNIGAGARIEDVLFSWKIIGHYRYFD
jgi:uncharacterized protein